MRKPFFNPNIFRNPKKYSTKIPIDKIVADPKASRKGIEHYKQRIVEGHELKPLVVVKHPKQDIFAVLDGHHRFYAQLESGMKETEAAIIAYNSHLAFDLTKGGWLQPSTLFTEKVRMPVNKFRRHFSNYLSVFRNNPKKLFAIKQKMKMKFFSRKAKEGAIKDKPGLSVVGTEPHL